MKIKSGHVAMRESAQSTMRARYDAFISYSHSADSRLARALETHLERFAKPWYQRQAANVFRDETSLSVSPHLWPNIAATLSDCVYFVLLASTDAAESKWVQKEVCYWITGGACDRPEMIEESQIVRERAARLLIVLTEGSIVWEASAATNSDFDWERTTALPSVLRRVMPGEPLWIDLRWARTEPHRQLNRDNQDFMQAIAKLSSPIRNLDIETLIGSDYHEHRKMTKLFRSLSVGLALGLIAAVVLAFIAWAQKGIADRQERAARHQEGIGWLARAASLAQDKDYLGAKLMAMRALAFENYSGSSSPAISPSRQLLDPGSVEYRAALVRVASLPEFNIRFAFRRAPTSGTGTPVVRFEPSGMHVATIMPPHAGRLNLSTGALEWYSVPIGALDEDASTAPREGILWQPGTNKAVICDWQGRSLSAPLELPPEKMTRCCLLPDTGEVACFSVDGQSGSVRFVRSNGDATARSIDIRDFVQFAENDLDPALTDLAAARAAPVAVASFRNRFGSSLVVLRTDILNAKVVTSRMMRDEADGGIGSVCISADAKRLMAISGVGQLTAYSDSGDGQYEEDFEITVTDPEIENVTLSPNGQFIAGSSSTTIRIWDVERRQMIATLSAHRAAICSIAFDPNGRLLASTSTDGMTVIWDAPLAESLRTVVAHSESADGENGPRKQPDDFLESHIHDEGTWCINDDGSLGATWDDWWVLPGLGDEYHQITIQVFDMVTRKRIAQERFKLSFVGDVSELRFSPASRFVIATTADGQKYHFAVCRPKHTADYWTAYGDVELNELGIALPDSVGSNGNIWKLPPSLMTYSQERPEGVELNSDL